jgi:hypothetical protein
VLHAVIRVQQHAMQLVLRLSSAQLASMMLCALIHDFGFVKEHVQVHDVAKVSWLLVRKHPALLCSGCTPGGLTAD